MSSRKEQKEALRAQRLERERAAKAAEQRKRLVGYGVGGALALAAVVGIVIVIAAGGDETGTAGGGDFPGGGSAPEPQITDLGEAAKASGCKLEEFRSQGREHTQTPVNYRTNPPTTGAHNPIPADDGAYIEAPPTESLVHSLEHGRVLIWFRPSLPDERKADLKALFDSEGGPFQLLLTPNQTGMPYAVAATAWGREPEPQGTGYLLGCPRLNDRAFDAIRAFIDEHRGDGPEAVP